MIALVVAAVFEYAISAAAIGVTLAALLHRSERSWSRRVVWFVLFVVFAALDTYWLPIARGLNASISIGNPAVAEALGVSGLTSLNGFLSVGVVDVVVWAGQAFVGVIFGAWVVEQRNVAVT